MNVERPVHPDQALLEAFAHEDVSDKPIVMVNLLRFRERADYTGTGFEDSNVSGKEAYQRYGRAVVRHVWSTGGQILWAGDVRRGVLAPSYEHWDQVALVYYPSRHAFIQMVMSDAYQEIAVHRTAALEDSRLLETRAVRFPKSVMGASRLAMRTLRRLRLA